MMTFMFAGPLHAQNQPDGTSSTATTSSTDFITPGSPGHLSGYDFRSNVPVHTQNQPDGTSSTATTSSTVFIIPSSPGHLTGHDFRSNQDYDPPRLERKGMQLFQHYGSTTATVVLKDDATKARFRFKPRPIEDSYPVVSVIAERIQGGKYLKILLLNNETIFNDQELTKDTIIPVGTYRVTLKFHKSSKENVRSHLELYNMTFE
ncbi:MAG: hypothetical protein NTY46_16185 [Candidatus Sumerlaeota bacterium]|nr:hypothetical protein [Candidatus Sumerlaeota bacterium]